jgi:hypothetical protein
MLQDESRGRCADTVAVSAGTTRDTGEARFSASRDWLPALVPDKV